MEKHENHARNTQKTHGNENRTNTNPKKSKPHLRRRNKLPHKPLQKNRKAKLKRCETMRKIREKLKEVVKETIIPIIKILIVFIPPLILHLYTIMWTFQVDLATAILTLFPIYLIFFPYFFLYLLIWIIILAKTKIFK